MQKLICEDFYDEVEVSPETTDVEVESNDYDYTIAYSFYYSSDKWHPGQNKVIKMLNMLNYYFSNTFDSVLIKVWYDLKNGGLVQEEPSNMEQVEYIDYMIHIKGQTNRNQLFYLLKNIFLKASNYMFYWDFMMYKFTSVDFVNYDNEKKFKTDNLIFQMNDGIHFNTLIKKSMTDDSAKSEYFEYCDALYEYLCDINDIIDTAIYFGKDFAKSLKFSFMQDVKDLNYTGNFIKKPDDTFFDDVYFTTVSISNKNNAFRLCQCNLNKNTIIRSLQNNGSINIKIDFSKYKPQIDELINESEFIVFSDSSTLSQYYGIRFAFKKPLIINENGNESAVMVSLYTPVSKIGPYYTKNPDLNIIDNLKRIHECTGISYDDILNKILKNDMNLIGYKTYNKAYNYFLNNEK